MKRHILCCALLSQLAGVAAIAATSADNQSRFITAGAFSATAVDGMGFSFRYGDKTVGPEWPSDSSLVSVDVSPTGERQLSLSQGDGLVVSRISRVFTKFGATEYRLRIKNTSQTALTPISSLNALRISFNVPGEHEVCVISSGGGLADSVPPPRNFAIRRNCFSPVITYPSTFNLTTEGGRSSNKDLPFFFLQDTARNSGVFVAFGWSGQWAVSIVRDTNGTVSMFGKIPDLNIALQPGEEMDGPTILLGGYDGSVEVGSNQLRRLIRECYTPELNGKTFLPVAINDHYMYVENKFDESLLRRLIDSAALLQEEYFLLDAEWFSPGDGGGWLPGVGNWELVDKAKLPNGLAPISNYIRSKGMKFGLWFEPERVGRGTKLAREHSDWVLWDRTEESETSFNSSNDTNDGEDTSDPGKPKFGLLDYSRAEVQDWVRNLLDKYIRDYNVQYIRYDFNMDPLPYWNAHDGPIRRGITQIRHIQGFYAIIDWLRARHPETVFEGCASGGRRIDLETARRFQTFWISDSSIDSALIRFHLFGLNRFLPGSYNYTQYALPFPGQYPNQRVEPNDLGFQSLFGGSFGTSGRIDLWPDEMKEMARRQLSVWKKLRRYLVEDFYPLSSQSETLESWSGWQFHDPIEQSGFVQTFRIKAPETSYRFKLHGLRKGVRYRFTDAYNGRWFDIDGESAMARGIVFAQKPMTSRVLIYEELRINRGQKL